MPAPKKTTTYIDWDSVPLGRATDAELAVRYGVDEQVICRRRVSRKIKAYGETAKLRGTGYVHHASKALQARGGRCE